MAIVPCSSVMKAVGFMASRSATWTLSRVRFVFWFHGSESGSRTRLSGFADRTLAAWVSRQIGCAHRSRSCLSGVRVRCLADRPARDDGLGSVLRPRASAAQTRCSSTRALPWKNGAHGRSRTRTLQLRYLCFVGTAGYVRKWYCQPDSNRCRPL
jgi:hypothetical protein